MSVLDSNPAFDLTHEKSMVVDDARGVRDVAQLGDPQRHRDARLRGGHAGIRRKWRRSPSASTPTGSARTFTPHEGSALIWCNTNGRERFAHFIDRAQHTLWLQNERYQDAVIIERVVRAARRGVKVHIIARPPHTLKAEKLVEGVGGLRIMEDVGAKVHKLKGLRLHGKMLLADGARAIVGSVNLAPGSFDARRELAIEVDDAHVVGPLEKVAKHDWDHSEPSTSPTKA